MASVRRFQRKIKSKISLRTFLELSNRFRLKTWHPKSVAKFARNSSNSSVSLQKELKLYSMKKTSQTFKLLLMDQVRDISLFKALTLLLMNYLTSSAGTPYANGHFKVKLVLGKDFPSGPPKGFFLTKIFHPNVSQQGEICVNTLKKDWKPDLGIKHIFLVSQSSITPTSYNLINNFVVTDYQMLAYCPKPRVSVE